jgi:hypothetical protein
MKPTGDEKQRQNKGGKGRAIKKPNRKGEKAIKNWNTKKGEKGRIKRKKEKEHKKTIKEEEPKIKVLAHDLKDWS